MARLASQIKAGFYPTPPTITELIASHITAEQGGRILDPCCGTGVALVTLAEGLRLEAYGVELHSERAETASELITELGNRRGKLPLQDPHKMHLIAGDYRLLMKTSQSGFNFLYLNPPYDTDPDSGRLEYQWLRDTRPWLQPGGLLVLVIPQNVLGHKKIARYLAGWYSDMQVYRFPDPEYARFRQIVLFGYRNLKVTAPSRNEVTLLSEAANLGASLDVLTKATKSAYTLPKAIVDPSLFMFESRYVDPTKAVQQAETGGVHTLTAWSNHLTPSEQHLPVTPLTPLKIGHLAGLLAAGFLDNHVLQDDKSDERLLIKGHAFKKTVFKQEITDLPDGQKQQTSTATEVVETNITAIEPDGTIKPVSGSELEVFLTRWMPQLTKYIASNYPPRYAFDYQDGPYLVTLNRLSKGRKIPRTDQTGLLPAQKHAVAALATHLVRRTNAILVGEMGSGKTTMGVALSAVIEAGRTLVICPPHLVRKWEREALIVWPEVDVSILNTISDVNRFFALDTSQPRLAVISHSKAKLASGWQHAVDVWVPPAPSGITEEERQERAIAVGRYMKKRGVRCPDCGGVILDKEGLPIPVETIKKGRRKLICNHQGDKKYRAKSKGHKTIKRDFDKSIADNRNCQNLRFTCGSHLIQFERRRSKKQEPGSFAEYVRREELIRQRLADSPDSWFQTLPEFAPPKGYARWPLARYIRQHHAGKIDLLIADEVHKFKGMSSDQGYAFQDLVVASKKILAMTGTIFGGKASSLFHLLYRLSPEVRRAFTDTERVGKRRVRWQEWGERYGVKQEVETATIDPESGKLTAKSRSNVRVKELPGASPAMLPWLINRTVFVSLADLGYALPGYEEIPVTVEMSDAQSELYKKLYSALHAELTERLMRNDKSLLGAYLQALLCWVDSPWRPEIVIDPYTKNREHEGIKPRAIVKIPALPRHAGVAGDQLFPKEKAIIDLITKHKAQGRRSLLFCQQTGTRDITGRWVQILADANLSAAVVKVGTDKREAWVKQQVDRGIDVLITHPKRVETGMDLLEFPTIIWMGTEYSVYTVMQASRRSWRIGQEEDVEVYFFNYAGTLQHDALYLIAAKIAATVRVNGDIVQDDSLAELDSLAGSDMVTALARIVAEGSEQTRSLSHAFASANNDFSPRLRGAASGAFIGDYKVPAPRLRGEEASAKREPAQEARLAKEEPAARRLRGEEVPSAKEEPAAPRLRGEEARLAKEEPVVALPASVLEPSVPVMGGNGHKQLPLLNQPTLLGHTNGKVGHDSAEVVLSDQKNGHHLETPPVCVVTIPKVTINLTANGTKRRRKYRRGTSLLEALKNK